MSDRDNNYIWQYRGYDNGIAIHSGDDWRDLESYRSQACERAYLDGLEKTSTNGGEYQFDIKNMNMYVIDFAFVGPTLPIRRVLSLSKKGTDAY
jgi:hypothetical protein